jgi:hypothetical protein
LRPQADTTGPKRAAALPEAAGGGIGFQAGCPLGGGDPYTLESPQRPLRSADELVGEAVGRSGAEDGVRADAHAAGACGAG